MHKRFRKGMLVAAMAVVGAADPVAARPPRAIGGFQSHGREKAHVVARRGRPRKFSRPSSSMTLTLPDDVIATLRAIDADLSRAVVRAVEPLTTKSPRPAAELATFGDRSAVILLPPSRALKEHTGVELVPLSDGRAMLSFDDRMSIAEFELRLVDAIADPSVPSDDRTMFQELATILRSARRDDGVGVRQRRIIVFDRTKLPHKRERRSNRLG